MSSIVLTADGGVDMRRMNDLIRTNNISDERRL